MYFELFGGGTGIFGRCSTEWRWRKEQKIVYKSREISAKELFFPHILTALNKRTILHICALLPILDILISKTRLFIYLREKIGY